MSTGSIKFSELPAITPGRILLLSHDWPITELSTDSRTAAGVEGNVFFAIKGERNDGHAFIKELYKKGVRRFVVETAPDADDLPEANIFLAEKSAVTALQAVAEARRLQFQIPVIAITGSNGKTIVKEWLTQLLAPYRRIVKSPKSYNSQIGVPLSVWQTEEYHELGIFEAGISRPGEMQNLEKMIRPQIGIFTNIGPAHDENFQSRDQKIEEKLKLFAGCRTLICRAEHSEILTKAKEANFSERLFTWSSAGAQADVTVTKAETGSGSRLSVSTGGEFAEIMLPFADEPSFENAMHCLTAMLVLGFDLHTAGERLSILRHVTMRMQLKEGINNCKIIDDTYNNDIAGIKVAFNFLTEQHPGMPKTMILSDVLESGVPPAQWCAEIAALCRAKDIAKFIGIGPELQQNASLFASNAVFYASAEDFLARCDIQSFAGEVILVKGARKFALENIVKKLENRVHGTVLEINLEALAHNLNHYRAKTGAGTRMMVMVKSLAYGAGSLEVAALLQHRRVDYLAVAYTDEAVQLRRDGISLPIMVMNPSADAFENIVEYALEPAIYDAELLDSFLEFLNLRNKTGSIHLEFDTGMHRLGFDPSLAGEVAQKVKIAGCAKVAGVFSHLACADDKTEAEYTHRQIALFRDCATEVEKVLEYPVIKHLANTAGVVNYPEAHFDMVRLGIGLYGSDSSGAEPGALRPALIFKSVVSQVQKLQPGDTVGYNRKGKIIKETEIATVAVGYGDGYRRSLSNGKGQVNIKGRLCPVVGNVCMDMLMVDVTGVHAAPGDEVILFGENPHADDVARAAGTIAYELFTGIGSRVRRVFVSE